MAAINFDLHLSARSIGLKMFCLLGSLVFLLAHLVVESDVWCENRFHSLVVPYEKISPSISR